MNVLIYTGYQKEPYNSNTLKEKGLGGTEQCCVHLAKYLKNFGWNVTVGGTVIEDTIEGIQWLTNQTIHKTMFNKFDVIIGVSYIHFLKEFEKYNCKKIFWVHNTDYFPWWKGKEIHNHVELLNSPDLDKIVCLTEWHRMLWMHKYNLKFNQIEVIGNGINAESFNKKIKKKKGKIIWSSAPERGLPELLENWPKIKENISNAELHVFTPSYSINQFKNIVKDLEGVIFRGNVSPSKLHEEMLSSEYWFYLTDYKETYCITAIEMQLSRVFTITTPKAALKETIKSGIVVKADKNRWENSLKFLKQHNTESFNKKLNIAEKKCKETTWLIRSLQWKNLIYNNI